MKTFTKISAVALFAMFLTACDKPAQKTAEPAKAETTQMAEVAKTDSTVDAQGVEDFKKLLEWNKSKEEILSKGQQALQQGIESQDKAKVEQALASFQVTVGDILKSLESLEIKNEEINAFKQKTKESLILSNELIADSVKAMAEATPELQQAIQAKSEKLMTLGAQLQQTQVELQAKFAK